VWVVARRSLWEILCTRDALDAAAVGRSTRALDDLRSVNTLVAIYPYKYQGLWVFDDSRVGLVQEPFISGVDLIIDIEGWLCPALFKYFTSAPPTIFAKFEPKDV
jgi:hypothetical protein